MKRKVMALVLAATMAVFTFTGCGSSESKTESTSVTEQSTEAQEETQAEAQSEAEQPAETQTAEAETENVTEEAAEEYTAADIRVGSLKGPTSMGLMKLMKDAEEGTAANNYTFTMETAADALLPKMIQGEMDIVLVPANVASVLYNKTEGGVTVIDINTLGVLYMVS